MITLEDVNSVLFRDGSSSIFHVLDTSAIGTHEFSDVKLDFCIVSHSISGSAHTFTFKVVNSAWTGAYYFLNANGEYMNNNASYNSSTGVITFTTSQTSVKLVLYCNLLAPSFSFNRLTSVITDLENLYINWNERNGTHDFTMKNLSTNATSTVTVDVVDGLNHISSSPFYYMVYVKKYDFNCNPTDKLTIGKVNSVKLGVSEAICDTYDSDLRCYVEFEDKIIDCYFDEVNGDYDFYVDLDLTAWTSNDKVKFTVYCTGNHAVDYGSVYVNLKSEYIQVDNFADLSNEILKGTEIIELSNNISMLSRINVNHDLIIYGNEHEIDLNECGFNIINSSTFKVENVSFYNGDTSIIQALTTKVELTKCTFTNCKSTNYNNLGSVIYCDVNLESLSDENDFTSNLLSCEFYNNHNCIFHGGQLTLDNCKLYNQDKEYVDIHNSALIYQTDGNATITNGIFDIDYDANYFCSNEINIGFAQSLIKAGTTAVINGMLGSNLNKDNNLPFFENPYNNQSHIFAKYYYSQISDCVYISPIAGNEDKSVCYSISGVDWVYKSNAQVTRASWNTQNNIRKFDWDDLPKITPKLVLEMTHSTGQNVQVTGSLSVGEGETVILKDFVSHRDWNLITDNNGNFSKDLELNSYPYVFRAEYAGNDRYNYAHSRAWNVYISNGSVITFHET